jgi:hypothetical protein
VLEFDFTKFVTRCAERGLVVTNHVTTPELSVAAIEYLQSMPKQSHAPVLGRGLLKYQGDKND